VPATDGSEEWYASSASVDTPAAWRAARGMFRLKPVDDIVAQRADEDGGGLCRSMGLLQLTGLSIGATLGTGIFVILGEAVPLAGPAVVLGFVLAAGAKGPNRCL
jgi:APA family basic amino acid/polyamine antiporter